MDSGATRCSGRTGTTIRTRAGSARAIRGTVTTRRCSTSAFAIRSRSGSMPAGPPVTGRWAPRCCATCPSRAVRMPLTRCETAVMASATMRPRCRSATTGCLRPWTPGFAPALTAAIERWLGDFSRAGFERSFPQGNYFAGLLRGGCVRGIALAGDSEHWERVAQRLAAPRAGRIGPALLRRQPRRRWVARGMELRADREREHEPARGGCPHGRGHRHRPRRTPVPVPGRQPALSPLLHMAEHDHPRGLLGAVLGR